MTTVISWQNGGTVGSQKATAEERALDTFKYLLKLEAILMGVNAVLAIVFGQLYETLGRRKTLMMCLVLLAVGVVLPAWAPEDDPRSMVYTVGRIATSIFASAVL
mmetsp:Transcript_36392/g.44466  ORF Transcript_36392/g.44466 Transcript_36392/m.44466 type:complete len:105 (+) Transcript_36392:318-632(+)